MSQVEPLPPEVAVEEPVRLCLTADLLPDGSFGRQWLVVAGETVHVFAKANGGPPDERVSLPLKDLTSPKVEPTVGGGVLEVSRDGETVELVRYTNARQSEFGYACQALEKWAAGEEAPPPDEDRKRCPTCGLPLEGGSKVCPICLPRSRTLRRLVQYLKPYWLSAVTLSLVACVNTATGLVAPYLSRPLMDRVLAPKGADVLSLPERGRLLVVLVMAMLIARVLGSLFSALQGCLSAWLGSRVTHDIRCQLFERLQRLALRFFDRNQMGHVISRVNQDTDSLQRFLVWGSQDLAHNLLLVMGISAVLFYMNWQLALLVLVPAPLVAILSITFWKRIRRYLHRFFGRWGKLNSLLTESLNGLRVVRAFAQEPKEIGRFTGRSDDLARSGVELERAWALLYAGMTLLISSGMLLIYFIGGRQVLGEQLSLGTLVAFMSFVGMFYGPVQAMSMLLNWASRSLTAAERVFEVLDSELEVDDESDSVALEQIEGRIEFDHVTFGYDQHKPVLNDVDLTIEPGEMIGLVGHSGAGKTTCINLLCRFYTASAGQVRVDGVPLDKVRLADLRHQMGIVPQDTFLFSGTILDNIAYAKPDATREEIIQAAKVANAHDFILKKPDGYETTIGEGGAGVSAGERQRIAIARAVLHDPRILILDEATSAVDVETEEQIQEAIQRLVRGRTTIAIAHRLSTLKHADRLVVLKDGKVGEMGTHDELLALEDGEFARLVKKYQEVAQVNAVER